MKKLKDTLRIPVLALVDSDPYGLKILSVYMKGKPTQPLVKPVLWWLDSCLHSLYILSRRQSQVLLVQCAVAACSQVHLTITRMASGIAGCIMVVWTLP